MTSFSPKSLKAAVEEKDVPLKYNEQMTPIIYNFGML